MLPRLLAIMLLGSGALAHAAVPVVKVTETSPEPPVRLRPHEPLYLRIEYQSEQPLRFQAVAYQQGQKPSGFFRNPSQLYPAGSGEAIAWVAAPGSAEIDVVRVVAFDERGQPVTETPLIVAARWNVDFRANPPASWAQTLSNAQQLAVYPPKPPPPPPEPTLRERAVRTLTPVAFVAAPAYPILQIVAFLRLRGGRRLVSALPLLFMLPGYALCLRALSAGSNLWPVWLVLLSPLAVVFVLGTLLYARWRPVLGS